MRKALFWPRPMVLLPMLLAAAACVRSPPIYAPPPPCSSLIPDDWRTPVKDAPAPELADDDSTRLRAWIGFGLGQTGQLRIANGRTRDALGIIDRCEARDREAVKRSGRRKVLGLF